MPLSTTLSSLNSPHSAFSPFPSRSQLFFQPIQQNEQCSLEVEDQQIQMFDESSKIESDSQNKHSFPKKNKKRKESFGIEKGGENRISSRARQMVFNGRVGTRTNPNKWSFKPQPLLRIINPLQTIANQENQEERKIFKEDLIKVLSISQEAFPTTAQYFLPPSSSQLHPPIKSRRFYNQIQPLQIHSQQQITPLLMCSTNRPQIIQSIQNNDAKNKDKFQPIKREWSGFSTIYEATDFEPSSNNDNDNQRKRLEYQDYTGATTDEYGSAASSHYYDPSLSRRFANYRRTEPIESRKVMNEYCSTQESFSSPSTTTADYYGTKQKSDIKIEPFVLETPPRKHSSISQSSSILIARKVSIDPKNMRKYRKNKKAVKFNSKNYYSSHFYRNLTTSQPVLDNKSGMFRQREKSLISKKYSNSCCFLACCRCCSKTYSKEDLDFPLKIEPEILKNEKRPTLSQIVDLFDIKSDLNMFEEEIIKEKALRERTNYNKKDEFCETCLSVPKFFTSNLDREYLKSNRWEVMMKLIEFVRFN